MPDILQRILAVKRREVAELAPRLADLKDAARDAPPPRGLARALARPEGLPVRIMAEVKHRSPSAGLIADPFVPGDFAAAYEAAGADAVSCLTDREFFGGDLAHLAEVRAAVALPVLRKDFLIDEAQLYEARSAGADGVLLIAEALEAGPMGELAALAAELGMDVLAEAHSEPAMEQAIASGAALVGINNRDLTTFEVRLETTETLGPRVKKAGRVLVAESGIRSVADVRRVTAAGADAVLVGESLLKSGDPAAKLAELKQA
jgi:indole-3-glycerol phosphate synthase